MDDHEQLDKKKLNYLIVLVFLAFSIIIVKLFFIQVNNQVFFSNQAFNNKKQIIEIPSIRGRIFLEDGTPIAVNKLSYSIFMIPYNFPRRKKNLKLFNYLIHEITNTLKIPYPNIINTFKKSRANPYTSYLLKKNVPVDIITYLAENQESFPGLFYQETFNRSYPQGEKFAHISGYIQNISIKELRNRKNLGYSSDSIIGKLGIEGYYDQQLRGQDGYKINIVDVKNRIKEEIFPDDASPVPGKDLFLTIDARIQNILHKTISGFNGGAIVTKASTGEVLGIYSYPSYDPNIFSGTIDKEKFKEYISNENKPFFNRVIQGEYPPSSIFKLAVAFTALDDPTFNPRKNLYYCSGGIYIGEKYFGGEGVHHSQNLVNAFANSCNIYFYRLGLDLGPNAIFKYSQDYFNLGLKTGIDLIYEKSGRLPSPKWKIEKLGSFWWDGDTANFSIGQGFALVTIAQINLITSTIANDGVGNKLHLLKKTRSLKDKKVETTKPSLVLRLPVKIDKIKIMQSAMRQVVQWGTAKRINSKRLAIAGKTGTAQSFGKEDPHSWFTGYAPYDAPPKDRLAVTVFIEHGGYGSVYAAVFTEAILQAIFNNRNPLLVVKERLQFFNANLSKYEYWLKVKKQGKLPKDYFEIN